MTSKITGIRNSEAFLQRELEGLDLREPVAVQDMTDSQVRGFGRWLALWTLIYTLAEAKGMLEDSWCDEEDPDYVPVDPEAARQALDGEMRHWMVALGVQDALTAPLEDILNIDEHALVRALVVSSSYEHCRNCVYLSCGATCRCDLGRWKELGLQEEYSHATVYNDSSKRFYCRDFISNKRN